MATNPNRPEYMDTIESTWGQSVADHVTRRYASAGERDADLAALTAADLFGQVVFVGPAGAPTGFGYLQIHNGTGWVTVLGVPGGGAASELSGVYTGHTAGQWGTVNIAYPVPLGWPGRRNAVIVTLEQAEGYFPAATSSFAFTNNNTSSGFQVGINDRNGTALPDGTPVCFSWHARAGDADTTPATSRPGDDRGPNTEKDGEP